MTYLTNSDSFPLGRGEPAESFADFAPTKQFPPERERNRISQFDQWWRWSNRSYVGLDPSAQAPGQAQFEVTGRRQVQRLAPNMFRFIMDFWGDAVAVDTPVVEYDGGGRPQELIDRLMPGLMRATRLVVADTIRYGCGVYWSRHALRPEALDPRFWYPIRPAYDPYERQGEVVATPWSSKPNSPLDRIAIYAYPEDGQASMSMHILDGLTIGEQTEASVMEYDGAGMVVPVRAREGIYGTSDFLDAAEYVAELHRRETQISEALDRHANPHLAVPEGVLQVNTDGSVTIQNDGMVIPVPEGNWSGVPGYVTWDASFEAQENGISRAEQRILRLSSIAPILATPGEFALRAGLPSGAALRRLAVISVNRLRAIREDLTDAWLRVLPAQAVLLAAQGGESIMLDADKINVEWPPEFATVADENNEGLPGGDQDEDGEPSPQAED